MTVVDRTCLELAEAVRTGKCTARAVTEAFLVQCAEHDELNALTYVASQQALAAADALDARRARSADLGPLAGVPVVVKDAICTEGLPTTAASRILQGQDASGNHPWIAPYSATVVERLTQAGAVVLAKANMDEFAMGSSNESSAYGPAKNPWDISRVPGGSSGGSAAAVAARMAPCALGSDTGGSIRQPASFCGVVGVKPSFGRVSRYGLIAFASSLDQIGPLTADVRSAAQVLEVIAGDDPRDSTTAQAPVGAYLAACDRSVSGLRVGVPVEYFSEGLDDAVQTRVAAVISALERAGASVVPVRLPHTHYGVATYYVLATAEASSNLSRFDGVRFGLRAEKQGANLASLYAATRSQGFGKEVQRRILLGTYVLSSGYYDAYYEKAQRVRTLIRQDFERAFSEVDALVTPASPSVAFPLGAHAGDPLSMYLADVFTLPASLAGIAGISVPVGTIAHQGTDLPVGAQVLCPALGEETLFRVAQGIESLVKDGQVG